MTSRVILFVDPPGLRRRLRTLLEEAETLVSSVRPGPGAWARLARKSADLVCACRSRIPEPIADSVRALCAAPDAPDLLLFSDRDEPEDAARLLTAGAQAVLPESLPIEVLRDFLRTLLDRRREALIRHAHEATALGAPRLADFVSASNAMRSFLEVVHRVADTDSTLLVLGETGVGKERLARAIHAEGRRSPGPFVAVNCAALPEGLLESELFGHEEGAFTGATRARRGRFELAHGGTLFLDEIVDLPLHLQVKLLRFLQEREIQPVGSERNVPVDVRVMAASNRDLEEAAEEGIFRRDLFYRLGVVTLVLPPLRERREDIPTLAESYLRHFRRMIGRDVEGLDPGALDALAAHDWPGNVRELINVMERAVLLCEGPRIGLGDLPGAIAVRAPAGAAGRAGPGERPLPPGAADPDRPWTEYRAAAVAHLERAYLNHLLRQSGGRIGRAADRAGLSPRSLYEKMRRHQLRKEDYR